MDRADELLLRHLSLTMNGTRAVLCALAQRGKVLRAEQPARSNHLLSAIQVHPLYKVGRLVFDLAGVEDVMLEGPQPEPLDEEALTEALQSMSKALRDTACALAAIYREAAGLPLPSTASVPSFSRDGSRHAPEPSLPPRAWPPLLASDYLYDMVVLGALDELARSLARSAEDA